MPKLQHASNGIIRGVFVVFVFRHDLTLFLGEANVHLDLYRIQIDGL